MIVQWLRAGWQDGGHELGDRIFAMGFRRIYGVDRFSAIGNARFYLDQEERPEVDLHAVSEGRAGTDPSPGWQGCAPRGKACGSSTGR